jgi:hypothetical protein
VANNNPPRRIDIKGQPHMLSYITPEEGGILQLLGGAGKPGPMGIPSFYGESNSEAGVDGPSGGVGGGVGADPSGTGTESPSTGGPTGYSGSISNAMAASSPTGMTGTGGIGGGFGVFGGKGMGMEDMSIAQQNAVMGGLSKGVTGLETMQGFKGYAPFGPGFFNSFKNTHARNSLARNYAPVFGNFNKEGNPTSITGKGSAGFGIPGLGPIGLAQAIGTVMGAVTTSGGPTDTEDTGLGGGDGNGSIGPIQPYQLPTNPYNRNEYRGTELPINTTIPNSPITTDPTVQDPNAERDYNLSQGLNEGYDFAKSPFAGMSINDTQLLTAPKEFSGVSSLDPLGAQDVYSNVNNDNMVKSYQDSAKGLDSVGADLRANKGYGM